MFPTAHTKTADTEQKTSPDPKQFYKSHFDSYKSHFDSYKSRRDSYKSHFDSYKSRRDSYKSHFDFNNYLDSRQLCSQLSPRKNLLFLLL